MRTTIFVKNLDAFEKDLFEEYLQQKIERLPRFLSRYDEDEVTLKATGEKFIRKRAYGVELVLKLPSGTLYAFEDSRDLRKAIDFAKDKLLIQIKGRTAKSGRERVRTRQKTKNTRQLLDEVYTEFQEAEEKPSRDNFFEKITPGLKKLYQMIRREIRNYQLAGDIFVGDLSPREIVDEAVINIYENLGQKPKNLTLGEWLYRDALKILGKRVKEIEREKEEGVYIGKNIPEVEPYEVVSDLEERRYDFYQPDEDLILEDVLPDEELLSPAERLSKKERAKMIYKYLSKLTPEERAAFLLLKDGFSEDEIAQIQHRKIEEVVKDLKSGERYLKEKIKEELELREI